MKKTESQLRRLGIREGFTLVELLVVITIIVVLAALSVVGLRRMRDSADKVASARNLSQLQLANANYATENNGLYCPIFSFDGDGVRASRWWDDPKFLDFLLGGSVALNTNGTVATPVPANLLDPVAFRSKGKSYNSLIASYGYCASGFPGSGWGTPNVIRAFRTAQVISPERSAAFFTATDWQVQYSSCKEVWTAQDYEQREGYSGNQRFAARYNKSVLVAYYDGHVSPVSFDDLRKIDSQGGNTHLFWNADGK